MLQIHVVLAENFNEQTNEFIDETVELILEHSLLSLSKWESIHEKPFLSETKKTSEELLSYVQCMIISPDISPDIVNKLSTANMHQIDAYINSKQTATWFSETKRPAASRQTVTSELIYSWMIAHTIPIECERWYLNRLITLIKIRNSQSQTPKKMSRSELAARNRRLNEERRAQFGTNG